MEFGKNCLRAAALMFLLLAVLADYGFGLPSTSLSPDSTTMKQFSSTQTSSASFSEIITSTTTTTTSSSPTTATTTAPAATTRTTTTEEQEYKKPTTTTTTTTTTSPFFSTTKQIAKSIDKTASKSSEESSDDTTTIIVVCCCVGGFTLLVIAIGAAYYIRRYLKKRSAKQTQSETHPQHPDGTSKANSKAKKPPTPKPEVAVNPWAPEHVPASTFAYKGPLVLQTRPPAEVPMVHELDNEQPPSIHESHHVQFDDTQNVVVEIGSDVEVFMDGDKKLPKKARSSLPSPYAESGGKAGGASGGGKAKKKMSEKQKDKAIRE